MKTRSLVFLFLALSLTTWGLSSCSSSKEVKSAQSEQITKIIDSQRFTFEANMIQPSRSIAKSLTPGYDLQVSKDTVSAYLPFIGRAYSAPMSSNDSGIKFTSTNFTYKATPSKKGGYNIRIQTNDTKERFDIYLNLSSSGSGTLTVSSNSREPINFSGYIK